MKMKKLRGSQLLFCIGNWLRDLEEQVLKCWYNGLTHLLMKLLGNSIITFRKNSQTFAQKILEDKDC